MIVASASGLCKRCDFFPEREDERNVLYVLEFILGTLFCALVDGNHRAMTALFEYNGSLARACMLKNICADKSHLVILCELLKRLIDRGPVSSLVICLIWAIFIWYGCVVL